MGDFHLPNASNAEKHGHVKDDGDLSQPSWQLTPLRPEPGNGASAQVPELTRVTRSCAFTSNYISG
jgi:hypothetical protein